MDNPVTRAAQEARFRTRAKINKTKQKHTNNEYKNLKEEKHGVNLKNGRMRGGEPRYSFHASLLSFENVTKTTIDVICYTWYE